MRSEQFYRYFKPSNTTAHFQYADYQNLKGDTYLCPRWAQAAINTEHLIYVLYLIKKYKGYWQSTEEQDGESGDNKNTSRSVNPQKVMRIEHDLLHMKINNLKQVSQYRAYNPSMCESRQMYDESNNTWREDKVQAHIIREYCSTPGDFDTCASYVPLRIPLTFKSRLPVFEVKDRHTKQCS